MCGSRLYQRNPPQGNILLEVCSCIAFAIKSRWRRSKNDSKRKHWLDWSEEKYSKRLIQEIKMVLRVLVLYIPLPMFWALYDQQGSRWTLQATRMNMAVGDSFIIKPDQLQMLNALLILLFIPVFDLAIYPLVGLCKINITPLRKMATGMIFAALAFVAATLVEVNVVRSVVPPVPEGNFLLQVINVADGDVMLKIPGSDAFPDPVPRLQDPPSYETLSASGDELKLQLTFSGRPSECSFRPEQREAYSLILYPDATGVSCTRVTDHIGKNQDGNPLLRFLNTLPHSVNLTVGALTFHVTSGFSMSANSTVDRGRYPDVSCCSAAGFCSHVDLGLLDFGASYTVVLTEDAGKVVAHKMEDVEANDVHIAWQIPQYVLLTMGEVMFSITGLEFSYSQAPANMKSVLQAGWLLTVAFGNVIVLIVAEGAGLEQWKEFLLFAGLLLAVFFVFSFMAHFYTYVDPDQRDKKYRGDSGADDEDVKSDDLQLNKTGRSTRL
uniref:solute carrier family 15 member 2 n=1 Tax=Gasterosteus aculeatus aculeatus TaxID=481459 RepID=UPI001A9874E7|nr:solute carrier family 15 member 2 [Gasterosteus aculeatus aculeatus]